MSVATYQSSRRHLPEAATPLLKPDISLRLHDKKPGEIIGWSLSCFVTNGIISEVFSWFPLGSSG
jgi:hypothetical protein